MAPRFQRSLYVTTQEFVEEGEGGNKGNERHHVHAGDGTYMFSAAIERDSKVQRDLYLI